MEKSKIYTFGYTLFSTYNGINLEEMFEALRSYGISHLVDVRSVPYSKQYPQCNSNNLSTVGKKYLMPYVHIPELGAKATPQQEVYSIASEIFFEDIFPIAASNRPEKNELQMSDEIVDFGKFRNDDYFLQGTRRIENAYDKGFVIALMCSEKDPVNCHRYFLVSHKIEQLFGNWISVEHIIRDKSGKIQTISNKDLNKELINTIFRREEVKKLDIFTKDLFGGGMAKIENYFGETLDDKIADFCDRYWNLMHGWRKANNDNKIEYYYD